MGSYIARQPNGLLCRFSSVVDAVTHYNYSEEDYIELCAERAREEARRNLQDPHFVKPFDRVLEVSDIYDRKVSDLLSRGEAVGGDGRKYKIENPDDLLAIGSSICVRATCIETGRNDAYDLDFFV